MGDVSKKRVEMDILAFVVMKENEQRECNYIYNFAYFLLFSDPIFQGNCGNEIVS